MTKFIRTIFIFIFIFSVSVTVQAQFDVTTPSGTPKTEQLPQPIMETMAKKQLEENKKEHERLIKRSQDAVKISEELEKSFAKNKKLTSQDQNKLKDLEKLLKRIRKDLGGSADEEDQLEEKPTTMANALNALKETTESLYEQVKKTTRYTISAVAIKSSNTVLYIVKFLQFGK
jgi:SMC interacting uncharacterized protein involved in chromosome segregation